jgi:hypothetical protein
VRTPPDTTARCEVCKAPLGYEIGSIQWQCKDHDFCGFNECLKKDCRVGMFKGRPCKFGTDGCMLTHADTQAKKGE